MKTNRAESAPPSLSPAFQTTNTNHASNANLTPQRHHLPHPHPTHITRPLFLRSTGVTQYLDGTIYIGDFAKDQRAGWGTLYYTNGDKYEGEWRDNKITGEQASVFLFEILEDLHQVTSHPQHPITNHTHPSPPRPHPPGKGRYTCQDGSYYEGEWAEGERTMGKLVSADGAYEYSGGWADNQRHGYGVMYQVGGHRKSKMKSYVVNRLQRRLNSLLCCVLRGMCKQIKPNGPVARPPEGGGGQLPAATSH